MRGICKRFGILGLLLGMLPFTAPVDATDGVVGTGNCNETGFSNVLAAVIGSGGGTVTFNCGAGSTTIAFTNYKALANTVIIDGAGKITFDGGGASAFFQVYASANATLKGLTFQHGVFNAAHALENFGTLTLDHVNVVDNTSSESPLANYGTLRVRSSTFSGNKATSPTTGDGAAINNLGTSAQVSASTFNGNSASRRGGAIYSEVPLSVVNSTFTANTGSLGGGAIYQTGSGASSVTYATIVGNSGPFGAGLYNDGGAASTLIVAKSIVSANSTGNCDGVIASGDYNLSNDGGCGGAFTQPHDLLNQTLAMQALGNNGGPTATMPPQAGNPAINHVSTAQCAIAADQRGAGRPVGAGCDSGAVEIGGVIDVIFGDGFEVF